jgi:hypothetical protein
MNEKQIETAIRKLRKLWHQNKTQIGKQRISDVGKMLSNRLLQCNTASVIPLTWNTKSVDQLDQCNTDAVFNIQGKPYGMTYAEWLIVKS